jgi:hypothetical protein
MYFEIPFRNDTNMGTYYWEVDNVGYLILKCDINSTVSGQNFNKNEYYFIFIDYIF